MSTMRDMLQLYRRHSRTCPHRKKGRRYTKCKCLIAVDGELHGKRFRRSTGVRDWQRALRKIAAWENPDTPVLKRVDEAIEAFIRHCGDLSPASLRKYQNVLNQLGSFCEQQHVETVSEITVEVMDDFRAQRAISPLTASKEVHTLRLFLVFCLRRRWLTHNVAKDIDPPKGVKPKEVIPYTEAEVAHIVAACAEIGKQPYERCRSRAMVLLMRYTALRISDVMTLARSRIREGMIHLHTQKTSAVVRLPISVSVTAGARRAARSEGQPHGLSILFLERSHIAAPDRHDRPQDPKRCFPQSEGGRRYIPPLPPYACYRNPVQGWNHSGRSRRSRDQRPRCRPPLREVEPSSRRADRANHGAGSRSRIWPPS